MPPRSLLFYLEKVRLSTRTVQLETRRTGCQVLSAQVLPFVREGGLFYWLTGGWNDWLMCIDFVID